MKKLEGSRPMKKEKLKSIIIVGLIVTFFLSATYAYLTLTQTSNNSTTGTGGCFEVDYQGTEINESSLKSLSITETNTEAIENQIISNSASSIISLSKSENCEIYTEANIYLKTTGGSISATSDSETIPLLKNYPALKYLIKNDTTTIAEGTINYELTTSATGQELIPETNLIKLTSTPTTYKVYLWIDSSISQGQYNNQTYSGYLYAYSKQTSNVTK